MTPRRPSPSCRRWRLRYDGGVVVRLVCTLTRGHDRRWSGPPHASPRSPWKWWGNGPRAAWVRDWICRGLVSDNVRCGKTLPSASEDEARAKGWKIGRRPNGEPDPLCPACGRPDAATVGHCRDLERSIVRHPLG